MERFIEFLENKNAWEGFERAFKAYERNVEEYKACYKRDKRKAIINAFEWGGTKEGFKYWDYLDYEWRKYIRPLKEQLLSDD